MDTQLLTQDIVIRLGLAMLAGMILGLNRWMHHKSAGIRTHTLVSLGGALGMHRLKVMYYRALFLV